MRAVRRAEEPFWTVEVVRQVLEARGVMPGIFEEASRGEVYLMEVVQTIEPGACIVRKGRPRHGEGDNRCWRRSGDQKQRNYQPVASPNLEIQPRGEGFSVLGNSWRAGCHTLAGI